MALDAATRARIQEMYSGWAWLLDIPDVAEVLERAATEGWPESRFISELQATNYYRTRTETARQMEALAHLDPATYRQRQHEQVRSIQDFSNRMGFLMNEQEVWFIANGILPIGGDINDEQHRIPIFQWVLANPDRVTSTGQIYANAQRAEQIAKQEFFYAPAYNDMIKFGAEAAFGYTTEDAFRQSMGEWMGQLNPHLASRLSGGETLAQIVNPFRDIVARELELGGVDGVDMLTTNQWRFLMGMPDPTSGEVRLPTQQEVISAARKDSRWKGTVGATSLATEAVTGITERFGVRT